MNTIYIQRTKKLDTLEASFGSINFNGVHLGQTLELGWNENKEGRSCIPAGVYQLLPHSSTKHPNTVAFHNPRLNVYAEQHMVPEGVFGRYDCLVHSANFPSELEGCLAPGTDFMYNTRGLPIGVKDSKKVIERLQKLWGDRTDLQAIITYV